MDTAYERWLQALEAEYPAERGFWLRPTKWGAEVYQGDELVTEEDYEPDAYAEQRVRY